jgi:hypothetical protein
MKMFKTTAMLLALAQGLNLDSQTTSTPTASELAKTKAEEHEQLLGKSFA